MQELFPDLPRIFRGIVKMGGIRQFANLHNAAFAQYRGGQIAHQIIFSGLPGYGWNSQLSQEFLEKKHTLALLRDQERNLEEAIENYMWSA